MDKIKETEMKAMDTMKEKLAKKSLEKVEVETEAVPKAVKSESVKKKSKVTEMETAETGAEAEVETEAVPKAVKSESVKKKSKVTEMETAEAEVPQKQKKQSAKTARFSYAQLISSKKYAGKRDILSAVLSAETLYSITEVEKKIVEFMKGRV